MIPMEWETCWNVLKLAMFFKGTAGMLGTWNGLIHFYQHSEGTRSESGSGSKPNIILCSKICKDPLMWKPGRCWLMGFAEKNLTGWKLPTSCFRRRGFSKVISRWKSHVATGSPQLIEAFQDRANYRRNDHKYKQHQTTLRPNGDMKKISFTSSEFFCEFQNSYTGETRLHEAMPCSVWFGWAQGSRPGTKFTGSNLV